MEEKRKVIVLLGDSLFAYRDQWGALDPEADIINLGRGGDNSVGTLRRAKTACGHKPDVVFLQAGINDLLQGIPTEDLVDRHLTIDRKSTRLNSSHS
jgi:lysophospholipase L1-like esterase